MIYSFKRNNPLKWFQSYLYNRKQYVYVNGLSSELMDIRMWSASRSVLGPFLFLIYINDLPNISNKLKLFLFADDTNIYYEDDNFLRSLENTSNNELKKLNQWLCVNRLALSISKTDFVLFHAFNKPIKENLTLKINHIAIKEQKIY